MNHFNQLPATATTSDVFTRLQQYPQLCDSIGIMLDEMENRTGTLNTADQAEDAIVERIRQLGRQMLNQWAQQRHAAVQPERTPELRQGGKKKSAG
jgi:hypothetical protein